MAEQREWSEEERREAARSSRFAKCGVCCFVAAGALLQLLTLPDAVHLLLTAPPVFGVDLMRWTINLFGLWGFCGSACVLASALPSIRAKPRRSKPGCE